jgi:ATP-dependent helicase/nuclease subunit A
MSRAPRLDAGERTRILADVARLLDDPALAPLFGPGSRGEAAIAGDLVHSETGEVSAVSGQVDRMVVLEREVLVADFKTGGLRDEHVAQIALYRALLAQIYPDRPVRAFLILTTGPVIVEPSPVELRAALLRALDGSG